MGVCHIIVGMDASLNKRISRHGVLFSKSLLFLLFFFLGFVSLLIAVCLV